MKLLKSSAVVSGYTLFSRILGGARDVVLTATLGAGPVADAFFTAMQFPNLFRRVFAEGAFSQAFVPLFARTLETEGEEAARRMASETLAVLLAFTAGLTILAQIAMPAIMILMQWGYRDDADIFRLSIVLTQITMPYLTFMALAALFAGVLNAFERFALAAFAPSLLNLSLLVAALTFRGDPRDVAWACAVAITLAGALQAGLLWLGCKRRGMRLRFGVPRFSPAVRRVTRIAIPGAIAASAVQINIIISQSLASIEEGAKSLLNYADRLYQLPLGLIGIAVGVAVLPSLSRAVTNADDTARDRTMDQALGLSMGLTLPAAAALLAIPGLLTDSLFARGAFTAEDASLAAMALFHFAWGVPAFVLIKVLAPAFYARHDTMRPMRYAMLSVVVNIVIGAGLFFWLRGQGVPGFPGLAVGTSAAAWLNVFMLAGALLRSGHYRPGPVLLRRLIGAVAASGVMIAALLALAAVFPALSGALGSKLVTALLVCGLAGAVYIAAAILLGVVRREELAVLLRRRRAA